MPIKNIYWFNQIDKEDINLVGEKGTTLGELTKIGISIPKGFIITTNAYYNFIKENELEQKIKHLTATIDFNDQESLSKISKIIKSYIIDSNIPSEMLLDIYSAYKKLGSSFSDPFVSVSCSTSYATSYKKFSIEINESYLNVQGESNLIHKIKECWSQLFTDKILNIQNENKFEYHRLNLAIVVQKMAFPDKSGTMYTINPSTKDKSKILIESVLGQMNLKTINEYHADQYLVDKADLKILSNKIYLQTKMIKKVGSSEKQINVSLLQRHRQKISDKEIVQIANLGKKLEKYFYFPQFCEWVIEKDNIYLINTKPITAIINADYPIQENQQNSLFGQELLIGEGINPGISTGIVRIIDDIKQITQFNHQEIIVTPELDPFYIHMIKKASAIITEENKINSHNLLLIKELGIPIVINAKKATKLFKTGSVITVNGKTGQIFKGGKINSNSKSDSVINQNHTATKSYLFLSDPSLALKNSQLDSNGVGLLNSDFMIKELGIHPKKIIKNGKKNDYIQKLSEGIEDFCKAFYPNPVIYRTSNLKSSEYRNLNGGKEFETLEPNPILGLRGTYKYLHDPEILKLELDAIKIVRDKKGYKNLSLMLPFVRNPQELDLVKKIIHKQGLIRSANFQIWVNIVLPVNIISLEDFIYKGIDGISISTDELAMHLMGIDIQNTEVVNELNERNPAVLWAIEKAIRIAGKNKISSTIYGSSAIDPEIIETSIKAGVSGIIVNPNLLIHAKNLITEKEQKLFTKTN